MSEESVCWAVRWWWHDDSGHYFESGGHFGFPKGTTWSQAIRMALEARSCQFKPIEEIEAKVLK